MQTNELNIIVKHYAGSLSYGTNLPTSDVDIRGIFCATSENIRTPFFPVREITLQNEEDGKLYELSNFMKLYLDGNPNILESLWVDKKDIISNTPTYDYLCAHRSELLSSKVAFTFSGYALSQLKRIKGHNKWINNPQPVDKPKHSNYLKMISNFTEDKIMPRDFYLGNYVNTHSLIHYGSNIFGLVEGDEYSTVLDAKNDFNVSCKQISTDKVDRGAPDFIIKYVQDNYKIDKEKHFNYWTWKNNRNETRSQLEEDYGYDTKHAMHLVRLLRMGEEILTGQGVIVKRPDAKELLDIRAGKWQYDDLINYAEDKDNYIRGELYRNTNLPKKPNIKLAAKVIMNAQDVCWK